MKKFVVFVVASIVASVSMFGQISISKGVDAPKKEAVLWMDWNWVYSTGEGYYLVSKTTNQYDSWMWIPIGTTKEECVESFKSLIEIASTMTSKDRFNLSDKNGNPMIMYKSGGIIWIKGKGFAGNGGCTAASFKKGLKWAESEEAK